VPITVKHYTSILRAMRRMNKRAWKLLLFVGNRAFRFRNRKCQITLVISNPPGQITFYVRGTLSNTWSVPICSLNGSSAERALTITEDNPYNIV
jgi:hypothetical protein